MYCSPPSLAHTTTSSDRFSRLTKTPLLFLFIRDFFYAYVQFLCVFFIFFTITSAKDQDAKGKNAQHEQKFGKESLLCFVCRRITPTSARRPPRRSRRCPGRGGRGGGGREGLKLKAEQGREEAKAGRERHHATATSRAPHPADSARIMVRRPKRVERNAPHESRRASDKRAGLWPRLRALRRGPARHVRRFLSCRHSASCPPRLRPRVHLLAPSPIKGNHVFLGDSCLAHGARVVRAQPAVQTRPAVQMPAQRHHGILHFGQADVAIKARVPPSRLRARVMLGGGGASTAAPSSSSS